MGQLVTTNSATLVNKGLEVIEAHLLFDVPYDRIEVMVHPQSVVHSMVEFVDGSTLAQASPPDMRLPISLALGWPDRVAGRRARPRLDRSAHLDVRPARHRGVPGRRPGPAGRHGRRVRAGGLQRGQRGAGGRVSQGRHRIPRHRRFGRAKSWTNGCKPGTRRRASRSRSSRSRPPTRGRGPRPAGHRRNLGG